ncbi:MAG: pirin family protein [Rhizobacter sp.]|nr:pirin family protein [Chlorobiales bacterium]
MIEIKKSDERFLTRLDWLESYHSFSFGSHYDPKQTNFGPLLVINDDTVQPAAGFGTHGHSDMEIVTYVLEGVLEHKDSTGGIGLIHAGEVQRMSAGTGIRHSEYNHSQTEPVHFLQIWFVPNEKNLKAGYEQKQFSIEDRLNGLLPIATGESKVDTSGVAVHQDVTMYVSRLESGKTLSHLAEDTRGLYLYVIAGDLTANSHAVSRGDSVKVFGKEMLELTASSDAEFVLFDVPLK